MHVEVRQVAREFLRALRAHRSQVAFSRRLGYSSNVAAEWESGRRTPLALTVFKACKRLGHDVSENFQGFVPNAPAVSPRLTDQRLADWLRSIKGQQSIVQLAHGAGLSRYQTSRFLSGACRPRLHELFSLIDASTGRLSDFVFGFVPLEGVPSLAEHHRAVQQSRRLAFEEPWTSAIVSALECVQHVEARRAAQVVSEMLSVELPVVERTMAKLVQVQVIREQDGHYRLGEALVIDTRNMPEGAQALRKHWSEVGASRIARKRPGDLLAYNVFSVSFDDFQEIRHLQLEHYHRIRAIVAKSKPEMVGLLNLQLIGWQGPNPATTAVIPSDTSDLHM